MTLELPDFNSTNEEPEKQDDDDDDDFVHVVEPDVVGQE
jgi:hypothetical protein